MMAPWRRTLDPNSHGRQRLWLGPRKRLTAALVYALLTLLSVAAQYRSGAYSSDFSLDPDEPAHAVSCLMVHDYLAQSFPANPLAFARAFHAHYPKVGIGHWPPLFYCAEGLWMLAAGRTRAAMLLFVALCGGAVLCSVFCTVRRRTSVPAAALSTAILCCFPTFQQMLCAVRPDLLLALLVFWAALFGGRMMLTRRRSWAAFAVLALAALLVHERGCALLLLPCCLFPFANRRMAWRWLVPAGIFLILVALPYLLGYGAALADASHWRNARFLLHASFYGWGRALVPVAAIGCALSFQQGRYWRFWASMSAAAIAGALFLVLLPFNLDNYYLITLLPPLAALLGGGLETLRVAIARLCRTSLYAPDVALCTLAIALMSWKTVHPQRKPDLGYHSLVANGLLCRSRVALVAGDAVNEGALIAEGSLADVHRERTILRGSKVLASSSWASHDYRMLYATNEEVDAFLDQAHVTLVVIELDQRSRPHVVQLAAAVAHNPAWVKVNVKNFAANIAIYERTSLDRP
jgi:hypothetical protein